MPHHASERDVAECVGRARVSLKEEGTASDFPLYLVRPWVLGCICICSCAGCAYYDYDYGEFRPRPLAARHMLRVYHGVYVMHRCIPQAAVY